MYWYLTNYFVHYVINWGYEDSLKKVFVFSQNVLFTFVCHETVFLLSLKTGWNSLHFFLCFQVDDVWAWGRWYARIMRFSLHSSLIIHDWQSAVSALRTFPVRSSLQCIQTCGASRYGIGAFACAGMGAGASGGAARSGLEYQSRTGSDGFP